MKMNTTRPETMWALRMHERGGSARLTYEEADLPSPAMGDVLVQVHAASFTPTELEWPSTWIDRSGRDRRPVVPGHEMSGVVADLGFGTSGVARGDKVLGITDWYRDGAAAEYVAVEARNLTRLPEAISHVESAAVPLACLTAWQALFVHGTLSTGQRVLVLGAGGGVGTFAVQLARWAGGHVVGSGRLWSRELVLDLGADEFVGMRRLELEGIDPVDLVVDLVGGELLERSWSTVKAGGRLVSVVEPPAPDAAERAGVRASYFIVEPDRVQLAEIARLIDAGKLRPVVGEVFDLADGAKAFEVKRGGGVPGKAVLRVVNDA
jgi:NADPH:quinone reductase-like Zn-dependent oxidoreductase